MKKLTTCIMTALLLILGGCSQKTQQNILRPMELNEQGKLISQLLNNTNAYPLFLSYDLKEDCKSVKVELWEWIDHQYESVYSHYGEVKKGDGNILVDFSVDPVSMEVVIENESGSFKTFAFSDEPVKNKEDEKTARGMVGLGEDTNFQIDEEIPVLVVQTQKITEGSSSMGVSLEAYKEPEKFIAKGMEHLYVITVKFQKEAS